MERLSPAVLVEVGDEIVEADRRRMTASGGVKASVSPATQYCRENYARRACCQP